jgi:hypothetical protein
MILAPLGHNYSKSPLGQPIQRKSLGQSGVPLGTSPLPSITNAEENEMMGDWSYSPRGEWGRGNRQQRSTLPIQARQNSSFPTPQSLQKDIIAKSNNIAESKTAEVQRSLSDSPAISAPKTDNEDSISDRNKISESTTPEIQRSPSETPTLSTPQTTHQNIIPESNNIVDTPTPEIQRSPLNSPTLSTPQTTHQNLVPESNNISNTPTPEIQRSPLNSPTLSTPQTTHQNLVPESHKIVDTPTPEIQRSPSETPTLSTPQTTHQNLVPESNNISDTPTPEIQRSPLNSPTLSTPQTTHQNLVPESNNISNTPTPEIQRSPLNSPTLSTPQTTHQNLVPESNNISDTPTPEIQRSLSELPGYQDVYSENNIQSPPKFSLNKFASNVIDNTLPIARKMIQRVREITSPESSDFSSSESVQSQADSLETTTPEIQRSPSETPTLSTPQTTHQNIIPESNNIVDTPTPEIQRSPLNSPTLSTPQTTHQNLVPESNNISDTPTPEIQRSPLNSPTLSTPQTTHQNLVPESNNISNTPTPEIQRSPLNSPTLSTPQTTHQNLVPESNNISDTPTPEIQRSLSELPGYQDVYSENNIQSPPKFSLNKFASNAIDNTLPIARKVIQRVREITSPESSDFSLSESIQSQTDSLETTTPEIQRSPLETPTLPTPQTTHQDIVPESNKISDTPTPEIQRSPLNSTTLSNPQTINQDLVPESNKISDTPTPEIQRSPLNSTTLSNPQTTYQNLVPESNKISDTPTPEIQRSPSEMPPISTQTDTAIEESPVTTLSEGRGFLQLQPLGQSQPLARDSDYLPSSFVSNSLKEILDYSGENNSSPIQKKEGIRGKTAKNSLSPSQTLDIPKSWSNVSELIGNSSDTPDSEKTEDWGGLTGLMGDTNLLSENPSASNAIIQTKNASIEGELLSPISFEEIEEEEIPSLPPSPQTLEQISDLEQPIGEEELEFLAQLVYRLVRSRLNIEREQQYNQLGGASFWLDTVYFARDEQSSLSSTAMLTTLETVNPYTSDRLAMLAREIYVLLQIRLECDRDRQRNYY